MKTLRDRWLLGAAVVARLLPHGRSLRMVDGIAAYDHATRTIGTYQHVPSNHPVFSDHFAEMPIWPGVFTLEAMAQTVILAVGVGDLVAVAEANGADDRLVAEALQAADPSIPDAPAASREALARLEGWVPPGARKIGILATADIRWERPVHPGVRLDYQAVLTRAGAGTYRATVEARVDGHRVAAATLTTVDAQR